MALIFYLFLFVLILQRLAELYLAHQNSQKVIALGAKEYGSSHYPWIVLLHTTFLCSLIWECSQQKYIVSEYWRFGVVLLIFAEVLRYWAIYSLGFLWNTRILVVPNMNLVRTGPYRYWKHPNYLAVILEFVAIPLIWDAWRTMFFFSLLNFILLSIRVRCEEQSLKIAAGH